MQYELPDVPEQYVHRIGRTARAGTDGSAVAFCAADETFVAAGHRTRDASENPQRPIAVTMRRWAQLSANALVKTKSGRLRAFVRVAHRNRVVGRTSNRVATIAVARKSRWQPL